ncbi:hypothetical protein B0H16DRAFT_1525989 [Mycena metata]|uniref:DUF6534 domain-containing protein n=1 Tax=Mycena metata TaxID=1033252 RepID=A0AAD7NJW9_9AGAR|nr:hypothetical protein B0H16DRAFT_1525989 [Mycena metata]
MLSQLDLSLGALEIGVLMSSTLWGVTTVQTYLYFTTPNKDPLWTKVAVWTVWILESFHTVFAWIYIYRLTVTFYGVPEIITAQQWSLSASSLFDGIIGAIVQMYFAHRVRLFSNSWIIPSVACIGSMLQLAFTAAITLISILHPEYNVAIFADRYGWLFVGVFATNTAVDIINTASLAYYLRRGRTGFKSSDKVLEKLVMWTVETGLVTAIAAIAQLVLVKAAPSTALWIGISLFYAKLYSNSFLAILNSRSTIRRGFTNNVVQTGSGLGSWRATQPGVQITVVHEQEQDVELKSMNDSHQINDAGKSHVAF